MARILVLFAHPLLERSRVHSRMVNGLSEIPNLTFRDLYETYPDFDVDIALEKKYLVDHDIIVWQHPLYWYSVPPLLKQWIDLVLEHGWAYGTEGKALKDKWLIQAISAGAGKDAYMRSGYNRYSIREFLVPFEQTAILCNMHYIAPYVVSGSHRLEEADIQKAADKYHDLLRRLSADEYTLNDLKKVEYLNGLLPHKTQMTDGR
jgi:glutathione-regulated potassium-efflux system ancillary protein KefG